MKAPTNTSHTICAMCEDRVHHKRAALGYKVCMPCGEQLAQAKAKQYTVAPAYNKGAYQVIPPDDIKYIGK